MARFAVKIEGKERIVELGEGAKPRVDGVEVDVEVVAAEPGLWVLRGGGGQTLAAVDGAGAKWIASTELGSAQRSQSREGAGTLPGSLRLQIEIRRPGGDPLVLTGEVADARRAKIAAPTRAGNDAAPVAIRSPIPGRVVKLLVKADEPVKAGQTVVVLEAMKMENELRAPRAGRVSAVRCSEGAAVEAGQDLIVLA
jgi:biotin carboxyl carrier protein